MKIGKGYVLIASQSVFSTLGLESMLVKNGYEIGFTDFNNILKLVKKCNPLAVIIFFDHLNEDIFEICKVLRFQKEFREGAIIFLSDLHKEEILIKSFDCGVDFFINRSVNTKLLLRRIDAIKRRFVKVISPFGNVAIDREKYCVRYKNISVFFPPTEFELLALLISKNGKLVLRSEIIHHLWGNWAINFRTLDPCIYRIRQKLGSNSVQTVKGLGYKISI